VNIEEIKERFKRYDFVHSYIDDNGCDDEWKDAHESIGYLLSIIEQAEKALERICTDPHTHRPARDFAFQVLQAITRG
jgi:hypothetical protein